MIPTRNHQIWVIVGNDWVPAIVQTVREPGMRAADVPPAGNNAKRHNVAVHVERVCTETTEAGAVLLAFPHGDADGHWRPLPFPWHTTDPRIWDIWDAANCADAGSVPLKSVGLSEAMKLRVHGKDGGDHPVFLRTGQFCRIDGLPGYRYNYCTVREAV